MHIWLEADLSADESDQKHANNSLFAKPQK